MPARKTPRAQQNLPEVTFLYTHRRTGTPPRRVFLRSLSQRLAPLTLAPTVEFPPETIIATATGRHQIINSLCFAQRTNMRMSLDADTARHWCTVPEQIQTRHVIIIALTQELFKQGTVNITYNLALAASTSPSQR